VNVALPWQLWLIQVLAVAGSVLGQLKGSAVGDGPSLRWSSTLSFFLDRARAGGDVLVRDGSRGRSSSWWEQILAETFSITLDRLNLWLPCSKLLFGTAQDRAGVVVGVEAGPDISGNDGCIVKKVDKGTGMTGEDDLLLGAFDYSSKMGIVGLLELLTGLLWREND
jgi:hypothetical protein